MPCERLELIADPVPRGAAMNMALDEVLLNRLGDHPVLRIYGWERQAVSFGCFEPAEAVIHRWRGYDLVRRWTGGGVVEHGNDLTFSLLVPRSLPLAKMQPGESYRCIHAAVADALARAGHAPETLQMAPDTSVPALSRACFERPVLHDLLLSGRKVAGGAQRRTRIGLLHQGSVQNTVASAGTQAGRALFAELANVLPSAFGVWIERRCLSPAELEAGLSLMSAKYATTSWLHRF